MSFDNQGAGSILGSDGTGNVFTDTLKLVGQWDLFRRQGLPASQDGFSPPVATPASQFTETTPPAPIGGSSALLPSLGGSNALVVGGVLLVGVAALVWVFK